MLTELWRNRELVLAFGRRDFSTRYRSSALGWAWSLLQPLAMLALFAVVFTEIFHVEAPPLGNGNGGSYPAYLFTGLVMWNLLTGLMNASMTQLLVSGELRRKVGFPAWTPVLGGSGIEIAQVLVETALLCGFLLILGNVGWSWLCLPVILLAAAMFAQGLGLALSMLNVRYGDVRHVTAVVLTLLYFLTPVLYPLEMAHSAGGLVSAVVTANPMTWFVSAMHDCLYSLEAPSAARLLSLLAVGYLSMGVGFRYFSSREHDLGERI